MTQLDIGKEYKLEDNECEIQISGCEVFYDKNQCQLVPYTPYVLVNSKDRLVFCGYGVCTIGSTQTNVCVFEIKVPNGPWPPTATIAIVKRFEHLFVESDVTNKNLTDNNTGQIYNPYNDSWSWI